jgi:hypothetical protein
MRTLLLIGILIAMVVLSIVRPGSLPDVARDVGALAEREIKRATLGAALPGLIGKAETPEVPVPVPAPVPAPAAPTARPSEPPAGTPPATNPVEPKRAPRTMDAQKVGITAPPVDEPPPPALPAQPRQAVETSAPAPTAPMSGAPSLPEQRIGSVATSPDSPVSASPTSPRPKESAPVPNAAAALAATEALLRDAARILSETRLPQ